MDAPPAMRRLTRIASLQVGLDVSARLQGSWFAEQLFDEPSIPFDHEMAVISIVPSTENVANTIICVGLSKSNPPPYSPFSSNLAGFQNFFPVAVRETFN